ncbi:MAG: undecaprenyl-diphosphate phosphatase [Candidatus Verstraetearchaeota archaeon]|nr:undecaprenyl-diphosphate phosphatase [Candidatus Verstraetearchaeota archaeon]
MDLLQAIVLALVQGLTEWLPISSSGHLVVAQTLMGLSVPVVFDIFLHLGTLVAVITYFWRDIANILRSLLTLNTKDANFKLLIYIIIGTIPTAVIGLLFLQFFESLFSSGRAVGVGLLITGALLLSSKLRKGQKNLGWLSSLIMGIFQGIAIAPGISRSGSTISAGLLSGVNKDEAFRYSFLLSIPAILGATVLEYKGLALSDLGLYAVVGAAIAAVSGYVAIKIVQKVLLSERFYLFAIYCFPAGLLVLLFLA